MHSCSLRCTRTLPRVAYNSTTATISLSILTATFPCEPGLAGFIAAKDDGSGGDNRRKKRVNLL